MSDDTSSPGNRNLANPARLSDERPKTVFLRSRPDSFFSNKFKLELEEVYSDDIYKSDLTKGEIVTSYLVIVNLALMILFIGVPILIYCFITSTN